ncbi:MAG TPA: MBL fold metallo-hydrolase, partial [Oscillospiraceae bacterium]|nr:MBL fold metallo-hydrolase [Oscillospiraceae bacterium]
FDTPHDAMQSCGYRIITSDGKTCAVCTDLGHVTPEVERNLNGCELVMLESNYDEKMLKCGSYPEYLKKRIRSKHGHLSNSDCAEQLKKLVEIGTTRIILAHLSQENNTPQIAAAAAVSGLNGFARDKDYLLEVAPVETVGKCVVF